MFKRRFDLIQEEKIVGTLEIEGLHMCIRPRQGAVRSYSVREVQSLELLLSEEIKGGAAVTGGIVGALIAGPFGAAAGASLGRLLRECVFIIEFNDGKTIACKGIRKVYDDFRAHLRLNDVKL